jgi:biopolymer transport protein ExbD
MKVSNRSSMLGVVLILAVVGVTAIVIALSSSQANDKKHEDDHAQPVIVSCKTTGQKLAINISGNKMSPEVTTGNVCDTLTITNSDPKTRLVAFGHHDSHKEYDGVTERVLKQDQSLTVTLNEKGTYTVHDHYDDAAEATFTVN